MGRNRTSFLIVPLALAVACSGEADDNSLPGTDNLGGEITNANGPLAGASVSIIGGTGTAMTDADGSFSLTTTSEGEVDYLIEAPGHWGQIVRVWINPGDVVGGVEVELATDGEVAEVATKLSRTISESKGIFIGEFFSDGLDLAGFKVQLLDMNQPVATDPTFTFDANEEPVATDTILGGSDGPELVFTGVPPGAYEISGEVRNGVGCNVQSNTIERPFPIRAKTISAIVIGCGSAE